MNNELNRIGETKESKIINLEDYSMDLIDVFETADTNESNNLTENVIISLQKFLMYHKGIVKIELTIGTSKEQLDALLKGLQGIMEIQGINLIDHQNGFITIETDISESPLEVETLGKALRGLIGIKGVQVNIVDNLYNMKRTFESIQEIEKMTIH